VPAVAPCPIVWALSDCFPDLIECSPRSWPGHCTEADCSSRRSTIGRAGERTSSTRVPERFGHLTKGLRSSKACRCVDRSRQELAYQAAPRDSVAGDEGARDRSRVQPGALCEELGDAPQLFRRCTANGRISLSGKVLRSSPGSSGSATARQSWRARGRH
jgi:hypothetical protein